MQRTQAILAAVVALIVIAVVAFFLLSGGGEPIPSAGPSASAAAGGSAAASASGSPDLATELINRRWTVLYVGTDLNEERENGEHVPNTDALMLVTVSEDQSDLILVSLPRDTVDVPLPDGGTYERKINGLYSDRGLDALVGAMEELYQVPIDGHVVLDMDDYTALVDAVGGVDVNPPEPIADPIVELDLEAGPQEIDATTANGYVRTRVDKDYGRMARQQEVLIALIERLTDPQRQVDLRTVLDGLDSLETDLPLDELSALLEVARRATDAELQTLVIQPPLITFEGDRGDGRGYVLEPDVDAIRAAVAELVGD